MTEGGWDTDAETVVSNLEAALNLALDSHSPAQRMVPMGENVAAGIGQGAGEYDFSADAETIASALEGALETVLGGGEEGGGAAQTIGEGLAQSIGEGASQHDFSAEASGVASAVESALGTAFGGEDPAVRHQGELREADVRLFHLCLHHSGRRVARDGQDGLVRHGRCHAKQPGDLSEGVRCISGGGPETGSADHDRGLPYLTERTQKALLERVALSYKLFR